MISRIQLRHLVKQRQVLLRGGWQIHLLRLFLQSPKRNFNEIIGQVMEDQKDGDDDKKSLGRKGAWRDGFVKCLETMGITFGSIAVLAVAGLAYHEAYKHHVLSKMNAAFEAGDPAANLKIHNKTDGNDSEHWVCREQQPQIDRIIAGDITGRYFLIVGEKGTGKTSLILEAMRKVGGLNVTMLDAHSDPEIFRIRLGKALNFSFYEDYIGSLFSMRGPRDTTALLDIERAFSKLEELALARSRKGKTPLVLIINNCHLIRNDEEGEKLLELLQQKAESLSGLQLCTMVFNSDDYWVYEKLKKLGTRLELINVKDFNRDQTVSALRFIRQKFNANMPLTDIECHQVYDLIGGRPQHIQYVAQHRDIFKACHEIIDREKTWFLNQCGLLGMDMDDDVMELGKFSYSAMLLMKEFVKMDREAKNPMMCATQEEIKYSPPDVYPDHQLPQLPLWRLRQVMTRPDYIQIYDSLNIFTLDSHSNVRADSVPMMRAFHEIASQPGFDELLEDTMDRVGDIEALGRTREVTLKDLNLGSNYIFTPTPDRAGYVMNLVKSRKQADVHGDFTEANEEEDDGDDDLMLETIAIGRDLKAKEWRKRWVRLYATNDKQDPR